MIDARVWCTDMALFFKSALRFNYNFSEFAHLLQKTVYKQLGTIELEIAERVA